MNAANAMRVLVQKFRQQSLLAMAVEVAVAALVIVPMADRLWVFTRLFWCVPVAVAAGLFFARRRWPRAALKYYFTSRRVILPALCVAGGWGVQYAAMVLGLEPFSFPIVPTVSLVAVGGLVAAGALSVCIAIFEGKAMSDWFDIIPKDQQAGLLEFLRGKPTVGQRVDLSGLDEAQVVADLQAHVIGQDEAVAGAVHAIFHRARHPRDTKPLASLLFVGPSGMGKSQLAKEIARVIFGGKDRLVALTMNELQDKESLWTVLGPPRGYQGSEQGGTLPRAIGRLGTGVILLDEFGRGAPELQEAMMTLLDEGKVTERSTGDVYSARGFVVIATSNSGQDEIAKILEAERDPDQRAKKVRGALRAAGMKDPVVNRFDGVYPFGRLSLESIARVIVAAVHHVAERERVSVAAMDRDILIDLVRKQSIGADAGLRGVEPAVERLVADGMADARDAGARQVAIRARDGQVIVEPAAAAGEVQ